MQRAGLALVAGRPPELVYAMVPVRASLGCETTPREHACCRGRTCLASSLHPFTPSPPERNSSETTETITGPPRTLHPSHVSRLPAVDRHRAGAPETAILLNAVACPLSHARPALSRLSAAHQRLSGAWSGSIDAPTGPRGPSCRPRTGSGAASRTAGSPANSLPAGPRRSAY